MNRLGAALQGEAQNPPVQSLYVFGSNPAATAPNAGKVRAGLLREDLFTVVHELFMTDTAALADIVLPATSQLEQVDLHKAYGHATLSYNGQALPPLAESKSNWEVMGLLAAEMGFTEPWLYDDPETIMVEVLAALGAENPHWPPLTLAQIKAQGHVSLPVPEVPFGDGRFPTPSGKVELYSAQMAAMRLPPLPGYGGIHDKGRAGARTAVTEFDPARGLNLISGAAHHFVTSTFANHATLAVREGDPFVLIHPQDAARRGIVEGDEVIVENGRGWCALRARVRPDVRPGVLAALKGRWMAADGRNINWTTADAIGDMTGQSTFHSNMVWLRKK
jgi:anaerobic selenocysteine-containing dehydrogenase